LKPFDEKGAFRPVQQGDELRRLAVRGAGVTVLSQGLAIVIQMVATVVLARLLAPSDFGVVTMVTTFSLLLGSFGLNGFTEGVLQRDEIDDSLVSNLFWINIGVGILFSIGFAAAGSVLARFYGNPHVAHVALGISPTIFLMSTSVLHLALLKRAMCFSLVSAFDLCGRFISVGVSILLGYAGWGYWALVVGAIALPLTVAIGAWTQCRWIPSLPGRTAGTGSMVRFAINTYARYTLNYFTRNIDNLLVGWRFNAQALGFYKKAYDLFALSASQLLSPVAPVAIATLSRFHRDPIQYRRYFLGGFSILAFIGMWASADLTLIGKDLIRLLLGPAWGEAGRVFTFFGPGIGPMLLYNAHGFIHLSIGRADRGFRWGLVEFTVTSLLFLLGLRWGPAGVAAAWTASFWILAIPAFWYAGRPIQFGVGPLVASVWKYLLAALLAGGVSAGVIREIPSLVTASGSAGAAARIAMISLLSGILYLAAVILLHGGYAPIRQITRLLPDMVPGDRFPSWFRAVVATDETSARASITLTAEENPASRGR